MRPGGERKLMRRLLRVLRAFLFCPGVAAVVFRTATPEDSVEVLAWVRRLAKYERLGALCVSTEADLFSALHPNGVVHAAFADDMENADASGDGATMGFVLWYFGYSTFAGRRKLFVEDLFVHHAHRSKGVGRFLLGTLAKIAAEEDCASVEWAVLDGNIPAHSFCRSLAGSPVRDWSRWSADPASVMSLALNAGPGSN
ncbi:MAG: GNAT family N-acetyltransferase [Spirochaetales bacterium]|nr:GNAT family N-acetyltransferase [Spirochaetales bacterium]